MAVDHAFRGAVAPGSTDLTLGLPGPFHLFKTPQSCPNSGKGGTAAAGDDLAESGHTFSSSPERARSLPELPVLRDVHTRMGALVGTRLQKTEKGNAATAVSRPHPAHSPHAARRWKHVARSPSESELTLPPGPSPVILTRP